MSPYEFANEVVRDTTASKDLAANLMSLFEAYRNEYLTVEQFDARLRELVQKVVDNLGTPGLLSLAKSLLTTNWDEPIQISKSRRAIDWSE